MFIHSESRPTLVWLLGPNVHGHQSRTSSAAASPVEVWRGAIDERAVADHHVETRGWFTLVLLSTVRGR